MTDITNDAVKTFCDDALLTIESVDGTITAHEHIDETKSNVSEADDTNIASLSDANTKTSDEDASDNDNDESEVSISSGKGSLDLSEMMTEESVEESPERMEKSKVLDEMKELSHDAWAKVGNSEKSFIKTLGELKAFSDEHDLFFTMKNHLSTFKNMSGSTKSKILAITNSDAIMNNLDKVPDSMSTLYLFTVKGEDSDIAHWIKNGTVSNKTTRAVFSHMIARSNRTKSGWKSKDILKKQKRDANKDIQKSLLKEINDNLTYSYAKSVDFHMKDKNEAFVSISDKFYNKHIESLLKQLGEVVGGTVSITKLTLNVEV